MSDADWGDGSFGELADPPRSARTRSPIRAPASTRAASKTGRATPSRRALQDTSGGHSFPWCLAQDHAKARFFDVELEYYTSLRFVVTGVTLPIVAAIGVIGNVRRCP